MKPLHVVHQKRFNRFLEIHVVLILAFLISCNSSGIEKKRSTSDKTVHSYREKQEQLLSAVDFLKQYYLDTFTFSPIKDTTIGELMARLDPYSCYLSKESSERQTAKLDNSSTMRFGFSERIKNDTPFVRSLNPLSICKKNGLCIGDQLLALDTTSLVHRSSAFFGNIFSECNGEHHTLRILRPGENIPRSIAIRKCSLPGDARSSILEDIPKTYSSAPLEIKREIISSIYPKNLEIENGNYRTPILNEALTLITSNFNNIEKGKNKKQLASQNFSHTVARTGYATVLNSIENWLNRGLK